MAGWLLAGLILAFVCGELLTGLVVLGAWHLPLLRSLAFQIWCGVMGCLLLCVPGVILLPLAAAWRMRYGKGLWCKKTPPDRRWLFRLGFCAGLLTRLVGLGLLTPIGFYDWYAMLFLLDCLLMPCLLLVGAPVRVLPGTLAAVGLPLSLLGVVFMVGPRFAVGLEAMAANWGELLTLSGSTALAAWSGANRARELVEENHRRAYARLFGATSIRAFPFSF